MTAHLMSTALPFSLDDGAPFHLSAFVTHKLAPDGDASLGDFPAVASWITTLGRGTWQVSASTLPEPVVATVVSQPDQTVWSGLLPPSTLVRGFPQPHVSEATWNSYPAHTMDEIATVLHLAAVLGSPAARPRADNAVTREVLGALVQVHRGARGLLAMLDEKPDRPRQSKAQLDAAATLSGRQPRGHNEGGTLPRERRPNAVEVLLDSQIEDERRVTAWLDDMVERGERPTGVLGALVDVHAARRFYQRPEAQVPYRELPDPDATTPPVENPEPDFHQLAASAGSTPALLRALGLAVDLTVASEHRAALAKAEWVGVAFVPDSADAAAFEPVQQPRTRCHVAHGVWQAIADSTEWVGGRLPLADSDRYAVLWLDPDATGLSTEQNLRNLVGELASELNGDKANGAPTALRSSGFSLARVDRVDATRSRVQAAETLSTETAGDPLSLGYDQIVRGLRLQVREGTSGPWRSVHRRLIDVLAADRSAVLTDALDEGYLPLTSLNRSGDADDDPYYLHQVFAGWEGWSLSAPRPGKVVVNDEHGVEQLVDDPHELADPAEPTLGRVRSRVAPGTLPRLRYGRSYAFRVQGVDLAGNEVGEGTAPRVPMDTLRSRLRERRVTTLGPQLRRTLAREAPARRESADPLAARARTRTTVRPRLAETAKEVAGDTLQIPVSRIQQTERRLADLVATDERRRTAVDDLDRLRAAVGEMADRLDDLHVRPDLLGPLPGTDAAATETLPMPFLRWSPVPPPALVARHELSPGESLQRLVIREGETSQRHVVPAKTSQLEAELHGRFDDAIGATDPSVQRTAYGWALRERGTLLDQWVPDLDNPGQELEQPGMSLASRPGANPDTAVTLAQITADRDTPLGEGQYVVHGVDQLVLPYLPDPLAAGLALVFYDAGAPHTLPEPRVLSAVVVPFTGEWPRVEPLRLVLEPGPELSAGVDADTNVVRVRLPAGEQVRMAVSSSLREEDLETLGLWRMAAELATAAGGEALLSPLRRAALAGWTWWLTPSEDMRIVHATPRPARRPALHDLAVLARPAGATVAALFGITDVHGASTARLSVEATWSEWVDDITMPEPMEVQRVDVPVRSAVAEGERYGVLFPYEGPTLGSGGVPLHKAIQTFADTHHRRVSYTLIGATRYAEYFPPEDLPGDDDPQSRADAVELTIVSSARPDAPVVLETVPLILWDTSTEPDQPFARRRVRRSGARLWLSRPWYTSGDGELLAVVLGDGLPAAVSSRWGQDPGLVHASAEVPSAAMPPLLTSDDLLFAASDIIAEPGTDADLPPRPGGPVRWGQPQVLVDVEKRPTAALLGYEAEFHRERGQWCVDVVMNPGDVLWPFVRLAVARYQPDSLAECALSPVVMTDWVQPLPERTATVSRPDAGHVHVTVTGAASLAGRLRRAYPEPPFTWDPERPHLDVPVSPLDAAVLHSRVLVATVQERGESDLEWRDHAKVRLPAVGQDPESDWQVTWSERLELPEDVPLATPELGSSPYRLLIEELEVMEADADPAPTTATTSTHGQTLTRLVTRVVYADAFDL